MREDSIVKLMVSFIRVRRILMKDLPEDDDELASWLQERFRKKVFLVIFIHIYVLNCGDYQ